MGADYLSTFNPEKLAVEYMEGVTNTHPIVPRRYTLTHSDLTGDLFLNIGINYALEKTNPLRDEVLGELHKQVNSYAFYVYLYVDQGEFTPSVSAKRHAIFRKELPLALQAIRYGDRFLFRTYPYLNYAPIIVTFVSFYSQYASQENWGNFQSITT